MKEIQSNKNPLIKTLKKLHQKKYRDQQNQYLLEGFHLVEEAHKSGAEIQIILVSERGQKEWGNFLTDYESICYLVSESILKELSDQPTPQGIIAVVAKDKRQQQLKKGAWILLDRVQDPGNVGTIIRTADAAGYDGVILGDGSADIYSTKVLRSMQGSNFHLPVITMNLVVAIHELKKMAVPIYGTELNKAAKQFDKVPKTNAAILVGNEGQGVSKELLALTDQNLYIPIFGQAESLNVGVAAGILLYYFKV
ncbi:23S rRNA methyltransferase [Enterococcus saigonensis]|uniref:23S rRNA methyltransferase n=1 Tax=Enterococcus saigonensis TaxID=1805431 RepID=A0A679IAQ5_9ENTE|nr:RNA methyltransferase [Enterococcus saigonensis]BCA85403.1 23S rRNA methyltransferase [Enterococcus saigonensis]